MTLYLNNSAARRRFKDILGNANHFLVTILIGLSAVVTGKISEPPPELHAAWNPKDVKASTERSRVMMFEMMLSRAVDALDSYIMLLHREPTFIQDKKTHEKLFHETVFGRTEIIHDYCGTIDPKIYALINIMIVWRNLTMHSLAKSTTDLRPYWKILEANQDWLKNEFQGMEFEKLQTHFHKGGVPAFKETTSFIRATHEFVRQIDETLLSRLDPEPYMKRLIWMEAGGSEADAINMLQKTWSKDEPRRKSKIELFLINHGLSRESQGDFAAVFNDELLTKFVNLSRDEALEYIKPL